MLKKVLDRYSFIMIFIDDYIINDSFPIDKIRCWNLQIYAVVGIKSLQVSISNFISCFSRFIYFKTDAIIIHYFRLSIIDDSE